MSKILRGEILSLEEYAQIRSHFLKRIIALKKHRRVQVGPHMTFIFENKDTVLFQIQEMLRIERITSEKAIAHEIETYSSLLPQKHELFATLMIEFDDPELRKRKLEELVGLRKSVFLQIGEHEKVQAAFEDLPGEELNRVPAVNYVRFKLSDKQVGLIQDEQQTLELCVQHPDYSYQVRLPLSLAPNSK